jgi:probable F420-dependent oxidoreductase
VDAAVTVVSPARVRSWVADVRAYEAAGFGALYVPDHVGLVDPFVALGAAAVVTDRMRVGTYVLNGEFWNPVLLARAAATVAAVSNGRFDLGLGAGHARVEFEQSGIPYPSAHERVDRLAATVDVVTRLLAGETVDDERFGLRDASVGEIATRARVLVGGNGDRVLHLAGERADAVGLTGFTSGTEQVHTNLSHWTWDGLADRIAHVERAAHAVRRSTPVARTLLVQRVIVTDDRRRAAHALADATGTPVEAHLDSPFVLLGTEHELADQLHRLRDDARIDTVTVFDRDAEAIAPLLAGLGG